jgi:hypothetical protein
LLLGVPLWDALDNKPLSRAPRPVSAHGGIKIGKKTEGNDIVPMVKSMLNDTLDVEDIIMESLRDLVKDEVKRHIKQALDKDPTLRKELKEAVNMYLEARAKQILATVKLAKGAAKLGLSIMPGDLKKDLSKEVMSILEKEIAQIMDSAL